MTLKVQLVMFYCKKNSFVQFVTGYCLFYIFNHVKIGGCRIWNHTTLSYFKIIKQYLAVVYVNMNREYNSRVSWKNSERLLKNLKNTTGDYFFCRTMYSVSLKISHWGFLAFSPNGWEFFINFFTHLLYVPIYAIDGKFLFNYL